MLDILSSPLRGYIAQYLQFYLSKYIEGIQLEGLGLFGGDVVLNDLEIKRGVLAEALDISSSFDFTRGFIRELRIHIPWTKLLSQPIEVKLYTIELILTDKQMNRTSSRSRSASATPKEIGSAEALEQPKGSWLQKTLQTILANLSIQINNLVVKYEKDDIVLTMALGFLDCFSANKKKNWSPHFEELEGASPHIFKRIDTKDLTMFLDYSNSSEKGQSTNQDPTRNYDEKRDYRKKNTYELPLLNRAHISIRCKLDLGSSHSMDDSLGSNDGKVENNPSEYVAQKYTTNSAFYNISECQCSDQKRKYLELPHPSVLLDPFYTYTTQRNAIQPNQEFDIFVNDLSFSLSDRQIVMLSRLFHDNSTVTEDEEIFLEVHEQGIPDAQPNLDSHVDSTLNLDNRDTLAEISNEVSKNKIDSSNEEYSNAPIAERNPATAGSWLDWAVQTILGDDSEDDLVKEILDETQIAHDYKLSEPITVYQDKSSTREREKWQETMNDGNHHINSSSKVLQSELKLKLGLTKMVSCLRVCVKKASLALRKYDNLTKVQVSEQYTNPFLGKGKDASLNAVDSLSSESLDILDQINHLPRSAGGVTDVSQPTKTVGVVKINFCTIETTLQKILHSCSCNTCTSSQSLPINTSNINQLQQTNIKLPESMEYRILDLAVEVEQLVLSKSTTRRSVAVRPFLTWGMASEKEQIDSIKFDCVSHPYYLTTFFVDESRQLYGKESRSFDTVSVYSAESVHGEVSVDLLQSANTPSTELPIWRKASELNVDDIDGSFKYSDDSLSVYDFNEHEIADKDICHCYTIWHNERQPCIPLSMLNDISINVCHKIGVQERTLDIELLTSVIKNSWQHYFTNKIPIDQVQLKQLLISTDIKMCLSDYQALRDPDTGAQVNLNQYLRPWVVALLARATMHKCSATVVSMNNDIRHRTTHSALRFRSLRIGHTREQLKPNDKLHNKEYQSLDDVSLGKISLCVDDYEFLSDLGYLLSLMINDPDGKEHNEFDIRNRDYNTEENGDDSSHGLTSIKFITAADLSIQLLSSDVHQTIKTSTDPHGFEFCLRDCVFSTREKLHNVQQKMMHIGICVLSELHNCDKLSTQLIEIVSLKLNLLEHYGLLRKTLANAYLAKFNILLDSLRFQQFSRILESLRVIIFQYVPKSKDPSKKFVVVETGASSKMCIEAYGVGIGFSSVSQFNRRLHERTDSTTFEVDVSLAVVRKSSIRFEYTETQKVSSPSSNALTWGILPGIKRNPGIVDTNYLNPAIVFKMQRHARTYHYQEHSSKKSIPISVLFCWPPTSSYYEFGDRQGSNPDEVDIKVEFTTAPLDSRIQSTIQALLSLQEIFSVVQQIDWRTSAEANAETLSALKTVQRDPAAWMISLDVSVLGGKLWIGQAILLNIPVCKVIALHDPTSSDTIPRCVGGTLALEYSISDITVEFLITENIGINDNGIPSHTNDMCSEQGQQSRIFYLSGIKGELNYISNFTDQFERVSSTSGLKIDFVSFNLSLPKMRYLTRALNSIISLIPTPTQKNNSENSSSNETIIYGRKCTHTGGFSLSKLEIWSEGEILEQHFEEVDNETSGVHFKQSKEILPVALLFTVDGINFAARYATTLKLIFSTQEKSLYPTAEMIEAPTISSSANLKTNNSKLDLQFCINRLDLMEFFPVDKVNEYNRILNPHLDTSDSQKTLISTSKFGKFSLLRTASLLTRVFLCLEFQDLVSLRSALNIPLQTRTESNLLPYAMRLWYYTQQMATYIEESCQNHNSSKNKFQNRVPNVHFQHRQTSAYSSYWKLWAPIIAFSGNDDGLPMLSIFLRHSQSTMHKDAKFNLRTVISDPWLIVAMSMESMDVMPTNTSLLCIASQIDTISIAKNTPETTSLPEVDQNESISLLPKLSVVIGRIRIFFPPQQQHSADSHIEISADGFSVLSHTFPWDVLETRAINLPPFHAKMLPRRNISNQSTFYLPDTFMGTHSDLSISVPTEEKMILRIVNAQMYALKAASVRQCEDASFGNHEQWLKNKGLEVIKRQPLCLPLTITTNVEVIVESHDNCHELLYRMKTSTHISKVHLDISYSNMSLIQGLATTLSTSIGEILLSLSSNKERSTKSQHVLHTTKSKISQVVIQFDGCEARCEFNAQIPMMLTVRVAQVIWDQTQNNRDGVNEGSLSITNFNAGIRLYDTSLNSYMPKEEVIVSTLEDPAPKQMNVENYSEKLISYKWKLFHVKNKHQNDIGIVVIDVRGLQVHISKHVSDACQLIFNNQSHYDKFCLGRRNFSPSPAIVDKTLEFSSSYLLKVIVAPCIILISDRNAQTVSNTDSCLDSGASLWLRIGQTFISASVHGINTTPNSRVSQCSQWEYESHEIHPLLRFMYVNSIGDLNASFDELSVHVSDKVPSLTISWDPDANQGNLRSAPASFTPIVPDINEPIYIYPSFYHVQSSWSNFQKYFLLQSSDEYQQSMVIEPFNIQISGESFQLVERKMHFNTLDKRNDDTGIEISIELYTTNIQKTSINLELNHLEANISSVLCKPLLRLISCFSHHDSPKSVNRHTHNANKVASSRLYSKHMITQDDLKYLELRNVSNIKLPDPGEILISNSSFTDESEQSSTIDWNAQLKFPSLNQDGSTLGVNKNYNIFELYRAVNDFIMEYNSPWQVPVEPGKVEWMSITWRYQLPRAIQSIQINPLQNSLVKFPQNWPMYQFEIPTKEAIPCDLQCELRAWDVKSSSYATVCEFFVPWARHITNSSMNIKPSQSYSHEESSSRIKWTNEGKIGSGNYLVFQNLLLNEDQWEVNQQIKDQELFEFLLLSATRQREILIQCAENRGFELWELRWRVPQRENVDTGDVVQKLPIDEYRMITSHLIQCVQISTSSVLLSTNFYPSWITTVALPSIIISIVHVHPTRMASYKILTLEGMDGLLCLQAFHGKDQYLASLSFEMQGYYQHLVNLKRVTLFSPTLMNIQTFYEENRVDMSLLLGPLDIWLDQYTILMLSSLPLMLLDNHRDYMVEEDKDILQDRRILLVNEAGKDIYFGQVGTFEKITLYKTASASYSWFSPVDNLISEEQNSKAINKIFHASRRSLRFAVIESSESVAWCLPVTIWTSNFVVHRRVPCYGDMWICVEAKGLLTMITLRGPLTISNFCPFDLNFQIHERVCDNISQSNTINVVIPSQDTQQQHIEALHPNCISPFDSIACTLLVSEGLLNQTNCFVAFDLHDVAQISKANREGELSVLCAYREVSTLIQSSLPAPMESMKLDNVDNGQISLERPDSKSYIQKAIRLDSNIFVWLAAHRVACNTLGDYNSKVDVATPISKRYTWISLSLHPIAVIKNQRLGLSMLLIISQYSHSIEYILPPGTTTPVLGIDPNKDCRFSLRVIHKSQYPDVSSDNMPLEWVVLSEQFSAENFALTKEFEGSHVLVTRSSQNWINTPPCSEFNSTLRTHRYATPLQIIIKNSSESCGKLLNLTDNNLQVQWNYNINDSNNQCIPESGSCVGSQQHIDIPYWAVQRPSTLKIGLVSNVAVNQVLWSKELSFNWYNPSTNHQEHNDTLIGSQYVVIPVEDNSQCLLGDQIVNSLIQGNESNIAMAFVVQWSMHMVNGPRSSLSMKIQPLITVLNETSWTLQVLPASLLDSTVYNKITSLSPKSATNLPLSLTTNSTNLPRSRTSSSFISNWRAADNRSKLGQVQSCQNHILTGCYHLKISDGDEYEWTHDELQVKLPSELIGNGRDEAYSGPSTHTIRRRLILPSVQYRHKMVTYTISRVDKTIVVLLFCDPQPPLEIQNNCKFPVGIRVIDKSTMTFFHDDNNENQIKKTLSERAIKAEGVTSLYTMAYDWSLQVRQNQQHSTASPQKKLQIPIRYDEFRSFLAQPIKSSFPGLFDAGLEMKKHIVEFNPQDTIAFQIGLIGHGWSKAIWQKPGIQFVSFLPNTYNQTEQRTPLMIMVYNRAGTFVLSISCLDDVHCASTESIIDKNSRLAFEVAFAMRINRLNLQLADEQRIIMDEKLKRPVIRHSGIFQASLYSLVLAMTNSPKHPESAEKSAKFGYLPHVRTYTTLYLSIGDLEINQLHNLCNFPVVLSFQTPHRNNTLGEDISGYTQFTEAYIWHKYLRDEILLKLDKNELPIVVETNKDIKSTYISKNEDADANCCQFGVIAFKLVYVEPHASDERPWIIPYCESVNITINALSLRLEDSILLMWNAFANPIRDALAADSAIKKLGFANKYQTSDSFSSYQWCEDVKSKVLCTMQAKIFINQLDISDVHIDVSCRLSSLPGFYSMEQTPFEFNAVSKRQVFSNLDDLWKDLAADCVADTIVRSPMLLMSLNIFGNPVGFFRHIRAGVRDFIELPLLARQSPSVSVTKGIFGGVASLLSHTSIATLSSISGFSYSISQSLDHLTLSTSQLEYSRERKIRPSHFTSGVTSGVSSLTHSLVGAATGVVTTPLAIVRERQLQGQNAHFSQVLGGVGLGLMGVVAKPISGIAAFVTQTSEGILVGSGMSQLEKRMDSNYLKVIEDQSALQRRNLENEVWRIRIKILPEQEKAVVGHIVLAHGYWLWNDSNLHKFWLNNSSSVEEFVQASDIESYNTGINSDNKLLNGLVVTVVGSIETVYILGQHVNQYPVVIAKAALSSIEAVEESLVDRRRLDIAVSVESQLNHPEQHIEWLRLILDTNERRIFTKQIRHWLNNSRCQYK